jgi:hypothetical protein
MKNIKNFVLTSAKKAPYRIAAEQSVLAIRALLVKALSGSDSSAIQTANMIMDSNVGKVFLQAAIGLALHKLPIDNIHAEKMSYELMVASVATAENTVIDAIVGEVAALLQSPPEQPVAALVEGMTGTQVIDVPADEVEIVKDNEETKLFVSQYKTFQPAY